MKEQDFSKDENAFYLHYSTNYYLNFMLLRGDIEDDAKT